MTDIEKRAELTPETLRLFVDKVTYNETDAMRAFGLSLADAWEVEVRRLEGLLKECRKAIASIDPRDQFGIGGDGFTHWYLADELLADIDAALAQGGSMSDIEKIAEELTPETVRQFIRRELQRARLTRRTEEAIAIEEAMANRIADAWEVTEGANAAASLALHGLRKEKAELEAEVRRLRELVKAWQELDDAGMRWIGDNRTIDNYNAAREKVRRLEEDK